MSSPTPTNPPNSAHRVGLKDIAAYANVSIGSVSSVLKNLHLERRIPQATADKIRKAAAELGYLPNINARSLRSAANPTMILALITSFEAPIPLINHFISSLHREAEKGTGHPPFSLMIEMFSAGELEKLPGLLTGDRFNAAVICNTVAKDDQFLSRNHLPYPAVLVNRSVLGYPAVVENRNSGTRAAEVLIAGRRTRPAVIHGLPLTQNTENRVNGFMQRVAEVLPVASQEIIAKTLSEVGGYNAMKAFLASGETCDSLYAVSDALALGAYQAIKEQGLKIPRDVSVVGVGDYEIAPFFDPPLSSVGVSHAMLADEASQLLFKRLMKEIPENSQVSLPILEFLRESTG